MANHRTYILGRMFIMLGVVVVLPLAIIMQILRIQFLEGDDLRELWNRQAIDFISIPAERGSITDSQGRILASNRVTYRVAADPYAPGLTRDDLRNVARILAEHSGYTAGHYLRRIDRASSDSRYVVLSRSVGFDARQELQLEEVPGLIIEEQYRRQYSFDSLAAHVLGFINHEYEGMSGLEASYNQILKGEDGVQQVRRDRSGEIRQMVGSPRRQPEQGNRLVTTLNADIQAVVEEELREGIKRTGSERGVAIVMNPNTGAVKAMANYPTFNPNRPASRPDENRRNYAVADILEPGSTYKLVTSVAAWEQGAVQPDEVFETPEDGVKYIHGQTMRDHNPLGDLSFPEVIQQSSNIATSEIAMRLEPEVLYQYSRNLGFGAATNVDLPNEEIGRLPRPHEWSSVTRPWLSIGYEVQATPMQLVQAYAAFANDGYMMRPYLVDRIENEGGDVIRENRPRKIRRAIEHETVEALRPIFEGVVSDSGTAAYADIEHLNIAGKTGTAQKFEDGSYQSRYRASFIGFYPSEDARYITFVMLDEPSTSYYGGYTAGPIFRNITERIIGLEDGWNISPQPDYELPELVAPKIAGYNPEQAGGLLQGWRLSTGSEGSGRFVKSQVPEAGTPLKPGQSVIMQLAGDFDAASENETPRVPGVTGMSMRKAAHIIRQAGYEVRINGSGTVGAQFPESETPYSEGRAVSLRGRTTTLTGLTDSDL